MGALGAFRAAREASTAEDLLVSAKFLIPTFNHAKMPIAELQVSRRDSGRSRDRVERAR